MRLVLRALPSSSVYYNWFTGKPRNYSIVINKLKNLLFQQRTHIFIVSLIIIFISKTDQTISLKQTLLTIFKCKKTIYVFMTLSTSQSFIFQMDQISWWSILISSENHRVIGLTGPGPVLRSLYLFRRVIASCRRNNKWSKTSPLVVDSVFLCSSHAFWMATSNPHINSGHYHFFERMLLVNILVHRISSAHIFII